MLEDRGVKTQVVSLENVIEAVFDVNYLDQNFYDYLSRAFASVISKCGDRVPVVTGKDSKDFGENLPTKGERTCRTDRTHGASA